MHEQLKTLADFPERHGLSAENDEFPYEIRDKLLGTGSRPSYRAVFTIRGDTVFPGRHSLRPDRSPSRSGCPATGAGRRTALDMTCDRAPALRPQPHALASHGA